MLTLKITVYVGDNTNMGGNYITYMKNLTTEINIEKSIKKGRIVFKTGLFYLFAPLPPASRWWQT
jgi:hypothetical protein